MSPPSPLRGLLHYPTELKTLLYYDLFGIAFGCFFAKSVRRPLILLYYLLEFTISKNAL